MLTCDHAARIAVEREPTDAALRAAENEAERLRALGRDLSSEDVYALAYATQRTLNKRHTRKAAARTRRKEIRYE